jgi:hypothetical protein
MAFCLVRSLPLREPDDRFGEGARCREVKKAGHFFEAGTGLSGCGGPRRPDRLYGPGHPRGRIDEWRAVREIPHGRVPIEANGG